MLNDLLEECKKYMLINDNLEKITNTLISQRGTMKNDINNQIITKNEEKAEETVEENVEYFTSKLVDKLFWSFYVIVHGEHNYDMKANFSTEKEIKIQCIEKLRKIKGELKALKLKLINIEDELLNHKKIGVKSLVALCLLYKINIVYVCNRKFIEIINNPEESLNVIINNKGDIKLKMDAENKMIDNFRETYLRVENIEKPFKSITGYTKAELLDIGNKLDIKGIDSKCSKKDIYDKIKFDWE